MVDGPAVITRRKGPVAYTSGPMDTSAQLPCDVGDKLSRVAAKKLFSVPIAISAVPCTTRHSKYKTYVLLEVMAIIRWISDAPEPVGDNLAAGSDSAGMSSSAVSSETLPTRSQALNGASARNMGLKNKRPVTVANELTRSVGYVLGS